MKKLSKHISIFCALLVTLTLSLSFNVYASDQYTPRETAPASNYAYYYSNNNPFYASGYTGQCTWYAFGRAYELLGSKPNLCTGNAGDWFAYNKSNGCYPYSTDVNCPKLGAIVCYSGHVAVVEKIENGVITVSEANVSGDLSFHYGRKCPDSYAGTFQGYIYVNGAPTAPTVNTSVSGNSVTVSWSNVGASSYYMYVYNTATGNVPFGQNLGSATSCKLTLSGGNYIAYVTAVYSSNVTKSGSSSFTIKDTSAPTAPVVKTSINGSSVSISWSGATGTISHYWLLIKNSAGTDVVSKSMELATSYTGTFTADTYSVYVTPCNGSVLGKSGSTTFSLKAGTGATNTSATKAGSTKKGTATTANANTGTTTKGTTNKNTKTTNSETAIKANGTDATKINATDDSVPLADASNKESTASVNDTANQKVTNKSSLGKKIGFSVVALLIVAGAILAYFKFRKVK